MDGLQGNSSPSCLQSVILSNTFGERELTVGRNPVCKNDWREGSFPSGQALEEGKQSLWALSDKT